MKSVGSPIPLRGPKPHLGCRRGASDWKKGGTGVGIGRQARAECRTIGDGECSRSCWSLIAAVDVVRSVSTVAVVAVRRLRVSAFGRTRTIVLSSGDSGHGRRRGLRVKVESGWASWLTTQGEQWCKGNPGVLKTPTSL